ncbi:MAG: DNA repair protein RadA [candidate division Zixibacteria bacterium]|nr:DNA repair protein RadA [candidate division Zixibacteria bacterium]
MAASRKIRTAYFCSQCGAEHAKWQGQCRECGQWNCLIEEQVDPGKAKASSVFTGDKRRLPEIDGQNFHGYRSGINEFDRVVGGQLLPGMAVLLGGEPGIGKSTLILQLAEAYSRQNLPVLYVTGEESLPQIKIRAARLGVGGDNITVINSTSLEEIADAAAGDPFRVVLVDSIQTVASAQFDSPPGTVAQVRETAARLISLAKSKSFALFLVGHITKDGMVAGPKVLEHMVDTVIYFEGDSSHLYRMLRPTKNRFGSVAEIGLFEMLPQGLVEVTSPSSLFLSEQSSEVRTGSVVAGICEGNRPILVEVQALVTAANYGNPQRVAGGIDNKRLALLLAILEKRCGHPMGTNDVFVSVAGGLRLSEPALDLPLLVAIASSLTNRAVPKGTLVVGEVGLSGEVRGITMIDRRIQEAAKMGFTTMVLPQANLSQVQNPPLELTAVTDIQSALESILG